MYREDMTWRFKDVNFMRYIRRVAKQIFYNNYITGIFLNSKNSCAQFQVFL